MTALAHPRRLWLVAGVVALVLFLLRPSRHKRRVLSSSAEIAAQASREPKAAPAAM